LNEFERWVRHPAQVALLLFALITAGVPLRALDWGTLALPVAVFLGKPVGLFVGIAVALALGFHLPHRVGWRDLPLWRSSRQSDSPWRSSSQRSQSALAPCCPSSRWAAC